MAYLHKDDIVMIQKPGGGLLQARVVDMQFRRFHQTWKDKKTGEKRRRWKAVPYAVCSIFIGGPIGVEFLIPGYKLRNETKDGEKLLVLRDKYVAEFDGEWVRSMLQESKEKREK